MPLMHLFLVAILQGLTEFLPVSSSGHLILLPNLTGLPDQGKVIDVAVHVGTLGAVMLYSLGRCNMAVSGVLPPCSGKVDTQGPTGRSLLLATIPVVIAGLCSNSRVRR